MNSRKRSSKGGPVGAGGPVLSQGLSAGRESFGQSPQRPWCIPGGRGQFCSVGSARQVAQEAGEVNSLSWRSLVWPGAGASLCQARPGCPPVSQGNPSWWCQEGGASSTDMEVPGCPGCRGSLAGPHPTRVWRAWLWSHPAEFPKGLEWSWQTAWGLWKGLDGAQSLRLEFWTQLVWAVG